MLNRYIFKPILLIILIICVLSNIQVFAAEPPKNQSPAISQEIDNHIKEEVRLQVEAKTSELVLFTTVVLTIVGLAVAVWAALGIISAIDNRKLSKLEKSYKHLKDKLDEDIRLHNEFIETSKLQEKKLAKLLILALPPGVRLVFIYILNGKLDTFITYDEINDVIKGVLPNFEKMDILMENLKSGKSRNAIIRSLKQLISSFNVVDTGNGYIFSIKDDNYKELCIEASKEFQSSKADSN